MVLGRRYNDNGIVVKLETLDNRGLRKQNAYSISSINTSGYDGFISRSGREKQCLLKIVIALYDAMLIIISNILELSIQEETVFLSYHIISDKFPTD